MRSSYSMIGYRDGDSSDPFLEADVSTITAKAHAKDQDLERFLLLPNRLPYQHRAYVRRSPGQYERTPRRAGRFPRFTYHSDRATREARLSPQGRSDAHAHRRLRARERERPGGGPAPRTPRRGRQRGRRYGS